MKLRSVVYAVIFAIIPAQAALCGKRDDMIAPLVNKYQESRIGMGLVNDTSLVEVYSSESGGTWTIIVTTPDGRTCMVAAGKSWQEITPEPMTKGTSL